LFGSAVYDELVDKERQRTFEEVAKAAKQIQAEAPNLRVSSKALDGSPKNMIVREAEDFGADLIVLGSHGYDAAT
jgi:nucleotide-binding universal stress UspA family protein